MVLCERTICVPSAHVIAKRRSNCDKAEKKTIKWQAALRSAASWSPLGWSPMSNEETLNQFVTQIIGEAAI